MHERRYVEELEKRMAQMVLDKKQLAHENKKLK